MEGTEEGSAAADVCVNQMGLSGCSVSFFCFVTELLLFLRYNVVIVVIEEVLFSFVR